MLKLGPRRALELGNDLLRERFTELHAPLVERINPPDRSLCKHAVLIERNEPAERRWRQNIEQVVLLHSTGPAPWRDHF